jgi:hypothetical protein
MLRLLKKEGTTLISKSCPSLGALQSGSRQPFPANPPGAKNPACSNRVSHLTSPCLFHPNIILYPDDHPSPRAQPARLCAYTISCPATMARVYADVNQNMPRAYWDYDSVNISELSGSVQPYPLYALAIACLVRTIRLTFSMLRLGCSRELRGRAQDRFVALPSMQHFSVTTY